MLRKTMTDIQNSNLDSYQQSSSELFYVFIGIFFFGEDHKFYNRFNSEL